jgi:hypothetical protein
MYAFMYTRTHTPPYPSFHKQETCFNWYEVMCAVASVKISLNVALCLLVRYLEKSMSQPS